MEWLESKSIPMKCKRCQRSDCYNCDMAGQRWVLSRKDELQTLRAIKLRAIARFQRQIDEIDRELLALEHSE